MATRSTRPSPPCPQCGQRRHDHPIVDGAKQLVALVERRRRATDPDEWEHLDRAIRATVERQRAWLARAERVIAPRAP